MSCLVGLVFFVFSVLVVARTTKTKQKQWKKHLIIGCPLVCWPFSAQRPLNTIAQKHFNAKGLVIFCWIFFGWCALSKTKQQNNKTTNNHSNNNSKHRKRRKVKERERENSDKKYPGKHAILLNLMFFFLGCSGVRPTRITTIKTKQESIRTNKKKQNER